MKKHLLIISLAIGLPFSGPALAQQVPAIDTSAIQATYMPAGFQASATKTFSPISAALPVLSEDKVKLNTKEQKAVNLANQWKNKPELPVMGEDGSVNFNYGTSMPSLVCAPLYACDVTLQPGEVVLQVDVGDSARWKVSPATSGNGDQAVTHLIVKPADAGLSSNMIVNTDRRTYNIHLVSKKDNWMPKVAFSYPEDVQMQWAAYKEQHQQLKARTVYTDKSTPHSDLDFNYRVQGDSPNWKPLRVYSDQSKTYIQFPQSAKHGEIPALVILGPGNQEQLVNYRMVEDRYVVDKVIDKAALITGVGRHQQRIEIVREGT
jgi:type IV secretion system protein TrbG